MFNKDKNNKITIDKTPVEDFQQSNESKARKLKLSLPKQVMVGFYANIKKADLLNYLFAKASSNMLMDNTYFGIKKYENGYLWELHEGGSGKGILTSLIKTLKDTDDIIIETADKSVRVLKRSNGEGLSVFVLNNDDIVTPTKTIVFQDKLKPVKSTGFGFFVFSTVFAGMGLFAAASLLIFKYGLFNEVEPLKFVVENDNLPISQIDNIHWVLQEKDTYLKKIAFSKKNGWIMDKEKEVVEKKDDSEIKAEVNKQLEALKAKMNLDAPSKEGESNE